MASMGSMKLSLHSPVTVYTCLDSFLSSLRTNLQISFEDLNASSHLDAFQLPPGYYSLPYSDDVTFSSGFADDLEDPPSPTDTSTTSTTQSFSSPTTWTYHASTDEDRRAALSLIADSIREQRLVAIRSILLHPAILTLIAFLSLLFVRGAWHEPQKKAPIACFVLTASVLAACILVERATRHYLAMASAVEDTAWLGEGLSQQQRNHNHNNNHHHHSNSIGSAGGSKHSHHNSIPPEDTILITKDHEEVIGALVLRTARTNALSSGAPSANGMRALRHRHSNSSSSGRLTGVIRAWTVRKSHRRRGFGLDLLESAVSICRVRRLDGPIFADEQLCSAHIVPGLKALWWPFSARFDQIEDQAKECLRTVIEGKERKR